MDSLPKPKCEVCRENEAISFSAFHINTESFQPDSFDWFYCCDCTADEEFYYIYISDFYRNADSPIEWMRHMSEKRWFNAHQFVHMLQRYRIAMRALLPEDRKTETKIIHCCFHKEVTPSLAYNEGLKKYHCFGCGKAGDIEEIRPYINNINAA